jgi:hypothetical protein
VAAIFIIVGAIVLALYFIRRANVAALLRGAAPAIGFGGASGAPLGGGQFGPAQGAITPAGNTPAPFSAGGGFNAIGGGRAVPTAPGGRIAVPWLETSGPIDWSGASAPVRLTSPLIVDQARGGTGIAPAGAVISVINGVPISLSDFALSKLGYSSAYN